MKQDLYEVRDLLKAAGPISLGEGVDDPFGDWAELAIRVGALTRYPKVMEGGEYWTDYVYHHWEWLGPVRKNGARIIEGRGMRKDIRVISWVVRYGLVPEDWRLRPVCGEELCINPSHFRLKHHTDTGTISQRDKRDVVRCVRDGFSISALARSFGISRQRIHQLVNRADGIKDLDEVWPIRPPKIIHGTKHRGRLTI